jgi:two-component system nitrogen regulation response regulator NtrX
MERKHRIVIVDDEPNIRSSLRLILEGEGYGITVCSSLAEFQPQRAPGRADLYLLDVRLPDGNGIDVLRSLKQNEDPTPVVMISGHATIRDAVEATRNGAFDFLEKPLARDRVLLVVKNAIERSDLQRENQRYRELVGDAPKMIGHSDAFRQVVRQATRVARSDAGVLLTGESGTGKELLAAHIHRESPFATRPFVKVNCAAIPTELIESELFGHERGAFTGATGMRRGKFELADAGTIFLDEVGDLHEASQAKLLRVLQDGELQRLGSEQAIRVSVRVIAATNRRLEERVAEGRFREDLYYRLSVVPIRVPALRERLEDVRDLAAYFLTEFCARNNFRRKAIDEDVLQLLESLRLAWQHPRAAQHRGAHGDLQPRGSHHRRGRAARDPHAALVSGLRPARGPRLGRARAYPPGARADGLERRWRRARAGDRAHEPAQAYEGARPESGVNSHESSDSSSLARTTTQPLPPSQPLASPL